VEVTCCFMDLLNTVFFPTASLCVHGVLIVASISGLNGCSFLSPANPPRAPYYFWDSNPQTKKIHAAVACTSPCSSDL
jgi:hypothetical protein